MEILGHDADDDDDDDADDDDDDDDMDPAANAMTFTIISSSYPICCSPHQCNAFKQIAQKCAKPFQCFLRIYLQWFTVQLSFRNYSEV